MKSKLQLMFFIGIFILGLPATLVLAQDKPPAQEKSPFESVSDSIIFLFSEDGKHAGTAFIIGYPVPDSPAQYVPLIVTAKHVLGDFPRIIGRYSGAPGKPLFSMTYDLEGLRKSGDLWEHPDEGVDIVIFRTLHFQETQYASIPIDFIASEQDFKHEEIHITDPVFLPGLLINFMGSTRNYPICRTGSIALIPDEAVPMLYPVGSRVIKTQQRVIFLNTLAVGGASGSPVFLESTFRFKKAGATFGGKFYLLGIVHGFYATSPQEVKKSTSPKRRTFTTRIQEPP